MLQELSIQNLALIEKLTLNFNNGFSTLTGETGAGKSILLDALGLALGERADSGLVRHNTDRADVSALFDVEHLPHVQAWLVEQDLDDDQLCYLRRTVTSEGRSKAYINGRPIPASQLKSIGNLLIDIHGQHEHQSLLSTHKQLGLLDAYAAHPELIEQTKTHYKNWQSLKQQLDHLLEDQADYQSKLELLQFQFNEFEETAPLEGEFAELSEEQSKLSHASEIKQACQHAYEAIEGEQGATDGLNQAIHAIENIIDFSPALEATLAQLNSALIEAQEAASEIQSHAESVDIDPLYLQTIEERLSQLFALAKKYNIDPEELIEKQQQIKQSLEDLEQSDHSIDELKSQIEQAWSDYEKAAKALSASRKKAATKLSKIVTEGMQQLGMPNGQFSVELNDNNASVNGTDKVEFLVTANKGQPLQALSKVASGGELSRISLAIQVATAEVASLPTLIFDEVDVGIGGGIAEVVGQKMRQLGEHKQILSITHLAQVASHGHSHLHISKQTEGEQTFTQVVELDEQGRVEELARMMGGLKITDQTLSHAQEMLKDAQQKSA
ncbi:DNA repair protein RecN [Thiomicrorhabdus sp. ZW0627]|uniref:DNA repair protein RecN n=1 Tax=Thiomicrorhabdus sp. ZW0627 TaxID=3039774 RepID=UPI0024368262|nr:DNA repair protein RecN [Thiomicrorhabdus sp. ZW0627]MDG6772728.1 DNA repair protein RecN [Thiomicrorhabdus sp. ZW0627]